MPIISVQRKMSLNSIVKSYETEKLVSLMTKEEKVQYDGAIEFLKSTDPHMHKDLSTNACIKIHDGFEKFNKALVSLKTDLKKRLPKD